MHTHTPASDVAFSFSYKHSFDLVVRSATHDPPAAWTTECAAVVLQILLDCYCPSEE